MQRKGFFSELLPGVLKVSSTFHLQGVILVVTLTNSSEVFVIEKARAQILKDKSVHATLINGSCI